MEPNQNPSFKLVEVTWQRTLKVWWSIFWRSIVYGMMAGLIIGFLGGFILKTLGLSFQENKPIFDLLGMVAGVLIQIGIIKYVLSKKYQNFRVALVKKETQPINQ